MESTWLHGACSIPVWNRTMFRKRLMQYGNPCLVTIIVSAIAGGSAWAEEKESNVQERSEIQKKYTWATENIFPDVKAWEAEYAALEKKTKEMSAYKGTL